MFKKRLLALLAASVVSATFLGGCGNNSKEAAKMREDPNTVPDTAYQIHWYLRVPPQGDVDSVELAVNEYLKDKINATVKMYCLEASQYIQKMSTMIASGEYFDLAFCASWLLNYRESAKAGAFIALDDYLDAYLKDAVADMDEVMLDSARVDGKIYALPANKEYATQLGWIYRKDIAEKYNIDMDKYKTYEELEPVLMMLKENEPDLQYPVDWQFYPPSVLVKQTNGVFRDGSYPDTQIVNYIETPQFLEACETARRFYLNGLIKKDVLTATDLNQRMNDGKTFVCVNSLKPGKVTELFSTSSFEFAQSGVDDVLIDYMPGAGSMTAISATSKNPVRAARFLNLLNSDPYLKNLITHGIEGKHYNKISENVVEPMAGTSYDLYPYTWSLGNIFIDYTIPKDIPNKTDEIREFNKQGKAQKNNLFVYDYDDEFQMIAQNIATIDEQYGVQAVRGAMDYKVVLEEWTAKRRAAGYDRLLEEQNRQYMIFLENAGK